MLKKSAITVFFVTIISSFAYTMEREQGSASFNQKLPSSAYLPLIQRRDYKYFSEALDHANECVKAFDHYLTLSGAGFDVIIGRAKDACDIYVALISKGYQEAWQPALEFAGKLYCYQGAENIQIPDFETGHASYSYAAELKAELKKESKRRLLCYAVKIYIECLRNGQEDEDNDIIKDAYDCAFKIFKITKDRLNHSQYDICDFLNENATEIYTNLIYLGYNDIIEDAEKAADALSSRVTNSYSKVSASLIYAALIKKGYNFNEVSHKALELAKATKNTSLEIILKIYAALVSCNYDYIYEDASDLVIEMIDQAFFYNKHSQLFFNLCAELVMKNAKAIPEYLGDWARGILTNIEVRKNSYRYQLSQAMPLFEALNIKMLLSNDYLERAKKWLS